MPRTAKSAVVTVARAKPRRPPAAKLPRLAAAAGGEPLYKQLVHSLRQEIVRGVFPVGSQLPTEDDLSNRFEVSRHTVREALRQLRADGLVSSRRGSGTTVEPPPPATPFNVHRVTSIDELIAYAAESRYEIGKTSMVDSRTVAKEVDWLPPKSRWLCLQGFRLVDETDAPPVCWTEVLVASRFAGVERLLNRQKGPIWRLIEDMYGERLVEIEQSMKVRVVPATIAEGLRVAIGSQVVEVCRTYKTAANEIAEVSVNLYPADKFRFSMKLSRA